MLGATYNYYSLDRISVCSPSYPCFVDRLTTNLQWSFCLSLPSARITDICHHAPLACPLSAVWSHVPHSLLEQWEECSHWPRTSQCSACSPSLLPWEPRTFSYLAPTHSLPIPAPPPAFNSKMSHSWVIDYGFVSAYLLEPLDAHFKFCHVSARLGTKFPFSSVFGFINVLP